MGIISSLIITGPIYKQSEVIQLLPDDKERNDYDKEETWFEINTEERKIQQSEISVDIENYQEQLVMLIHNPMQRGYRYIYTPTTWIKITKSDK